MVVERKDVLQSRLPYLVVDGYFAKKEFVNPVMNKTKLHLVCKQDRQLFAMTDIKNG